MKKSKLVLTGIAIGMCAMLLQQQHHCDNNNKQQRNTSVQRDSSQQNADTGIPLVRIGLQSNLY
jgi:hypothetical protein